jgi:hypothetical protein
MKIRPLGASCSLRMDGQTELIVAFSSFANAPKNHDGICIYKFASYVAKYKCCYLECVQYGQECVPCCQYFPLE